MFISVSYLLHSRCKLVLMFFTLSRIQQRPGARMKPNLPHVDAPYRRMNPQFSVPAFLPSAAQAPVFFVVINKVTLMTEPSKAAMFMCLFCFTKMLQAITIFVFLSFFLYASEQTGVSVEENRESQRECCLDRLLGCEQAEKSEKERKQPGF